MNWKKFNPESKTKNKIKKFTYPFFNQLKPYDWGKSFGLEKNHTNTKYKIQKGHDISKLHFSCNQIHRNSTQMKGAWNIINFVWIDLHMLCTHILAKITITWPIVRQQICELHLIVVKDVCMWQQIDELTHASKYKATNGCKIQQHMIMDFLASPLWSR